jgi:hypothetical protein
VKKKFIVNVSAVLFLLSLVASAQAASVIKMTVPDLVKESHRVVIGKVANVSSDWAQDRRQIYTTVTIDVSEDLKGSSGDKITFRQLGGVVGDTRASIAGFPSFVPGSEVLLFLNDDPNCPFATVGLGQGKFNITVDKLTGEKVVANDVLGLKTAAGAPLTSTETITMTLNSIKAAIAKAVDAPNKSQ